MSKTHRKRKWRIRERRANHGRRPADVGRVRPLSGDRGVRLGGRALGDAPCGRAGAGSGRQRPSPAATGPGGRTAAATPAPGPAARTAPSAPGAPHRRQRPGQQRALRPQLQRRVERHALARPPCAWATTSCVGPSHTPIRHASSEPSSPPDRERDDQRRCRRAGGSRKTTAALTAPKPSASSTNVPSAPIASSPSRVLEEDRLSVRRPAAPAAPATATAARAATPSERHGDRDHGGLPQLGLQSRAVLRVLAARAPGRVPGGRRLPAGRRWLAVRLVAAESDGAVTPPSCQARP